MHKLKEMGVGITVEEQGISLRPEGNLNSTRGAEARLAAGKRR
jgi:hypothetical protein